MVISLKDLVKKVRIKLNEDPVDEGFENGVGHEGLTLDQVIASVSNEVCERVLDTTVFSGFDDVQVLCGPVTVEDGHGRLKLPSDFHKFIELKLNCWEGVATEALSPGDKGYWRRHSVNPLVRGTSEDPRVYICGDRNEGWVELYPCQDGATIEYGSYLCNPWMTPVGSFYLPDRMLDHVTTGIAAKVREILER